MVHWHGGQEAQKLGLVAHKDECAWRDMTRYMKREWPWMPRWLMKAILHVMFSVSRRRMRRRARREARRLAQLEELE